MKISSGAPLHALLINVLLSAPRSYGCQTLDPLVKTNDKEQNIVGMKKLYMRTELFAIKISFIILGLKTLCEATSLILMLYYHHRF